MKELKAKTPRRGWAAEELGHIGQIKNRSRARCSGIDRGHEGFRCRRSQNGGNVWEKSILRFNWRFLSNRRAQGQSCARPPSGCRRFAPIGPDAKDAVPALRETQKDTIGAVSVRPAWLFSESLGRGKK